MNASAENGSVAMVFGDIRRWLVLLAGLMLQICLGAVYAWSVYVPSLQADFGWSAGAAQLVFGISIAMFTVATLVAGRLLERVGARWIALMGAILFAGGYLLASNSGGHFGATLAGIGVMAGIGIGLAYLSVLSTAVGWFPRHRGLVTGVAVTGFGAGAILLAAMVPRWLAAGYTVPDVFGLIGRRYGVVTCLSALLLFSPPRVGDAARHSPAGRWWLPLHDRTFWTLAAGLFCGTFAGLLVIGNLKPIGIGAGLSPSTAASAIGFFAAGNAGGRLLWGWIHDRVGYRAIPVSLFFLAMMVMLLLVMRGSAASFRAASLLCGFGFGACFVLYAAQTSVFYGLTGLGRVYPLLFLFYGFSGITGPPFGGFLFDLTGTYEMPVIVSTVILVIGGAVCWKAPVLESKV